jgi:Domain of unknown function (DUF4157)
MFINTRPPKETIRDAKNTKSSSNQPATDLGLVQFKDNRVEASKQQDQQTIANNSPKTVQLKAVQMLVDRATTENHPTQLKKSDATAPNTTGLPDNLKAGVESLSGMSMDGVNVHYNSEQPAQLNALAYAQGTDIHVGPGQEQHLPHEAWHVVQQAQGRVKPTTQLKEGVPVNDDIGLEAEADAMGKKALKAPIVTKDKL